MPFAIYILATVNVAIGTQSFVFSGLLDELAADLGVTIGTAGLLVPASAVTFAVLSPIAAARIAMIERKRVMVIGLSALAICNGLCVVAPDFSGLLALRIAGGVAAAFVGSIATASVTSLVSPQGRGRAFAVVVGGMTVALLLGVPLGSVIGGALGWRATFGYSAVVCSLCVVLILIGLPRIVPPSGERPAIAPLLRNPGIVRVFALTVLGFAAAFTIVAFLGPIIRSLTGLTGAGIGALQVFIGIGSFAGLAAGGIIADRERARAGLLAAFALLAGTALATGAALTMPAQTVPVAVVAVLILALSTAMFAAIPINLSTLSRLAGPATPVALAVNGSLVALGQGLGAAWGGLVNDMAGQAWLGVGAAVLALGGMALASRTAAAATVASSRGG